jgi:tripartite ATP-independent transporter DctP family solute receptor
MKKFVTIILTVIVVIVLFAGCGKPDGGGSTAGGASGAEGTKPPASSGGKIIIMCASTSPETSTGNTIFATFKEQLESNSDEFQVDIYPMGQLGGDRELLESCQDGSLQFVVMSTGPYANFTPDMSVFDLPFAFRGSEEMSSVIVDPALTDPLNVSFESVNLHLSGIIDGGFRVLWTQDPVKAPADIKGLKVRVMENENQMNTWRALGAQPTVVAFTELYTALQQGLVAAQDNSFEVTYINKFQELTPYVTKTNHLSGAAVFSMSKIFRDSLTGDQLKAVDDAWAYALENQPDPANIQNEYQAKAESENGVTVYEFTPEDIDACKEICADVWSNIQSTVSPEVFDGFNKAIENARK